MNRHRPAVDQDPRTVCPLCGYRFAQGVEVCGSCGIGAGGCETVGCPHCGYAFPTGSVTVNWFRRLVRRLRPHRPAGDAS